MIRFPGSSAVGKILPKEEFYKRLSLSTELKNKFVSDIRRITLENSLSEKSLRLQSGSEIVEILVLALDLKKREVDERILEQIARQNKHHILFLLRFDELGQLALYINKLYKTEWQSLETMQLETRGFRLDEVWNGYAEQIALHKEPGCSDDEVPIAYRLRRLEDIQRLEKSIDQLEKAARAEKQPKKKFELAMQARQLKKELNEL